MSTLRRFGNLEMDNGLAQDEDESPEPRKRRKASL